MTPAWRARHGCVCDAPPGAPRWKPAGPPGASKGVAAAALGGPGGGGPPPRATWPPPQRGVAHPPHHPIRTQPPPPPPLLPATLPLFHSRHAEQSAARPRLVTVVRPQSQGALRKVTVLLNRRGVVSFEQLLLDVSEALGFPRWHRARVTRLYTPHAREVRGVCDFFRGEVAFVALGRARPELQSVLEALEELFPEPSRYRADALRAWERRLRPAPDKMAAKTQDSGYSEGTEDGSVLVDENNTGGGTTTTTRTNPDAQNNADEGHAPHVAQGHHHHHHHHHRLTQQPPSQHIRAPHRKGNYNSDNPYNHHPPDGKYVCRQPTHPPNHLQRLQVGGRGDGGGGGAKPSSVIIGPFKPDEGQRRRGEAKNRRESPSSASSVLCRNCLLATGGGNGGKYQTLERPRLIPGKVPLPPVTRKHKGGSLFKDREVASPTKPSLPPPPPPPLPPPQPITRDEAKCQKPPSNPLSAGEGPNQELGAATQQQRVNFDLPTDRSQVALSDIELRYEMGRVVGDGNFAVVRECRCRSTGAAMAMKIVDRSKLVGREHMMQNELSLLGSLSHARVVRLFTHYHTPTHSYLLMELVAGGDLFEAIAERGRFPEEEAGAMVSDVSEALSYIHGKSIVHRDLKPENLLLERQADGGVRRLKLGDFGLAMVVTEPVFTICGTPTYVAPEILSETGYGLAVDVWALGVILYILLCGFPPFRSRDRDQDELFQLIKRGDLHFLSPYWDPISDGARGLVTALLQADPTARLTSAQTFQHPWVQAMTAACRQGALSDRTQSNTTTAAAAGGQSGGDQETPDGGQCGEDQETPGDTGGQYGANQETPGDGGGQYGANQETPDGEDQETSEDGGGQCGGDQETPEGEAGGAEQEEGGQQRPEATGGDDDDDDDERPPTASSHDVADPDTVEEHIKPDSGRSEERPVQSPEAPVQEEDDHRTTETDLRTASREIKAAAADADSLRAPSRTTQQTPECADQEAAEPQGPGETTAPSAEPQGPGETTAPSAEPQGPGEAVEPQGPGEASPPTASPNQQNQLHGDNSDHTAAAADTAPVPSQDQLVDTPRRLLSAQEEDGDAGPQLSRPNSPTPPQDQSDLHADHHPPREEEPNTQPL